MIFQFRRRSRIVELYFRRFQLGGHQRFNEQNQTQATKDDMVGLGNERKIDRFYR